MGIKDFFHKFMRRWDAQHDGLVYNRDRGTFEVDENLPAGHSRKRVCIIDPQGVLFAAIQALTAGQRAYITMIQCVWTVAPAVATQLNLTDGGTLVMFDESLDNATIHNEVIGDGSSVIATATTNITAAVVGGAPQASLYVITYYEVPQV